MFIWSGPRDPDGPPRVTGDDREETRGKYHGPQAIREHSALRGVLIARESDDRSCDRCCPRGTHADAVSSEHRGAVDAGRIEDDDRWHASVDSRLEVPVHVGWTNLHCAAGHHERTGELMPAILAISEHLLCATSVLLFAHRQVRELRQMSLGNSLNDVPITGGAADRCESDQLSGGFECRAI